MPDRLPASFVLDQVRGFIGQLVWCKPEYLDVMAAALAVSHAREAFTTVPYILATSDQPASGKSTIAMDLPMLLAFHPETVDKTTTQPALNAMYLGRETPNLVLDDISKLFNENGTGGKLSPTYALLVKSYRKGATTKLSRNGQMMDLPTYGMAFMNGLKNAVPHDLFTRSIHLQMAPAPDGVKLRDALDNSVHAEAKVLREALHSWAGCGKDKFGQFMRGKVRLIHPKLERRRRQTWGPLFAVAEVAGGDWPRKMFDAFVSIALDADETPTVVPVQQVLLDAADIIFARKLMTIFASDMVALLRELPEGQLYRDSDTEFLVRNLLPSAFGDPEKVAGKMQTGEYAGMRGKALGWNAKPILDSAAELKDMLYPEAAEEAEDPLADIFTFEPVSVKGIS